MSERFIYLDNAATTFPKPDDVLSAMVETYGRIGVSPGRGSYDMASEAEAFVDVTRQKLAAFFHAPKPEGVIFTANATDALNLAIQGLIKPGDHIVSTRIEHNSVLRPLYHLHQNGMIEYDLVPFDRNGFVDSEDIRGAIRPNTRLVIVCHASNVLGTIQPIRDIGAICAEKDVPLLIDAAQSAGVIPIDMAAWHVSALAITGHKSMLGPTGIGCLIVDPALDVRGTRFGGTGIDSKSLMHTQSLPNRLEAGTSNLLGIIGLSTGLDFVMKEGLEKIHRREMKMLKRLRDNLVDIQGIEFYGSEDISSHVALLTCNMNGMDPVDAGAILDADFGIAVRVGLHCAPLVHETIGSYPNGGIRFSIGPFNTMDDIDQAVEAISAIAQSSV